ncbi:hypothetical protein [Flagellimonas meishanensis]|uniref:hypothetical protein n=1 Tax=Flagellimonas meishanensis TaxID=2873264 RepID=UPI001CA7B0A7|nr:hypothetical protein [[Muricauda] meishanensis]
MDVIKEIIQKSAIGPLSNGYKSLVLSLFISIVFTLIIMFVALVIYGPSMNIQFGY